MSLYPAPLPAITQEVIFLDPDDDLGTVRAKLESTAADEVYLVIPRRASILRTPLEFRILARLAHDLSSETIIVAGDGTRRSLARQEGLRTKRSIRSIRHLSKPPGTRSWELPAIPDWVPRPSLTGLLLMAFMAAVAGVLILGVLPVMRVTVTAQTLSQHRDLEILVDPSVKQADLQRQTLPGEVLQQRVEVVASLPATGMRRVGRDRARGEVTFSSQSQQPALIPRGTVVVANSGARFQTDIDLQVPPLSSGQAKVGVTAVNSGTIGNVPAGQIARIESAGIQGVTVRNDRPTAGGSDRDGRVVTADDLAKLRELLQNRAREQALAELYARAGSERSLVQPSVKLRTEGESFDPGVDAEAEQVNGRLAVVATAVVFVNADFDALVQKIFLAGAGGGYDLPRSQLAVGVPQVLGMDDQKVRIKTSSDGTMVRQLNANAIAEQLRGKSSAEASSLLTKMDGLAGPSRVELSPSWAPWAYRVEVTAR